MVDILHRVGIVSSVDEVYKVLTTNKGLAAWWTTDTTGEGSTVGEVVKFVFSAGFFDMKVAELDPGKRVVWDVVDGPEEWIGTRVVWNLVQEDDYAIILFKHEGWREPVEFMHHCSTKWGSFLLSIKELVETGKGRAHPDDVKIDNWN
ncbi:SRPBCC family protein [Phytomonospora endophytica]|uniref:Uncharacterized protein YndB with AHSA1/START domain n=1 Tax=Phytomonospora endophytica TaxID=714109 RepID=A0A841FG58_9ACTN|nr:SRPBCC domain-containing protein [Phytomonospora endophytica]MBB6035246.1 uncharacterized protein YndB with AHSA1/START domain [Phytomonospora endophytica]GIG64005.1 activator of HSP90 ATPase [Phytomonospora endophytica]